MPAVEEQRQSTIPRSGLWSIYASAGLGMAGIQLLTPALPIIQRDLGLNEWQTSLLISVYLLPSILFAFVSGVLASRFGIKRVFAAALALFGFCGLFQLPADSLVAFLLIRFIQGAAFAALAPLSIALLGALLSGLEQVRAQGQRLVVMLVIGSTLLPFIGGVIALANWRALFAIQMLAIPTAASVWMWVPEPESEATQQTLRIPFSKLICLLRDMNTLAFVGTDALRMFFYFAFITYLPILAVNDYDLSPAFAGTAIAAAGISAAGVAGSTSYLLRLLRPSHIIGLSLLAIAASFVLLAAIPHEIPIMLASVMFGIGNGTYNTIQNSGMTQIGAEETRAVFIATIGSIRNSSKFLAPTMFGLATITIPLETVYMISSGVAITALALIPLLRWLDTDLTG